jgi:hypothetical protein
MVTVTDGITMSHKNRLDGAAVTFVLIDHVLVQSDGRCGLLAEWAS